MTALPVSPYTPKVCLSLERASKARREFCRGERFVMAGANGGMEQLMLW